MLSLVCISLTLYGAGCVFIVLIAQLFSSILLEWASIEIGLCLWMVIISLFLTPLTWMGTPKDFWSARAEEGSFAAKRTPHIFIFFSRPIAVGALLTTVTACVLIMVQSFIDYFSPADSASSTAKTVEYPTPTVEGSFKAFGSIMFAFAGASTFPTIQADMRRRDKFKVSAVIAMISKKRKK